MGDLCFLVVKGLQSNLGSSPVSSLRIVPDPVVSAHTNPIRDGSVLLEFLCESLLRTKCLVAGLSGRRGLGVS